jgi:hypothetical protein
LHLYDQLLDKKEQNLFVESNVNIIERHQDEITHLDQIFNMNSIKINVNPIQKEDSIFYNQLYVVFLRACYDDIDPIWIPIIDGIISPTHHETILYSMNDMNNKLTKIDIHIVFVAKNDSSNEAVVTINKHCIFLLK